MKCRMLLSALFVAALTLTTPAENGSFAYQGVLKTGDGGAVTNRNQTIQFRLYNSPTASSGALWGRAFAVLLDTDGLFNVEISDSGSALPNEDFAYEHLKDVLVATAGGPLYIGLTVANSSGEIRPRQRILSVPYATIAGDVSSTSGNLSVGGTMTAGGVDAGSITTTGAANLASLEVSGKAEIGTGLTVKSGTTTINGSSVTIEASTTVKSPLTVEQGDISVDANHAFRRNNVDIAVPVGGIIMWNEAEIPDGWAICNGQQVPGIKNGKAVMIKTPDLRERFVVGVGESSDYALKKTGGQAFVTLTAAQSGLPAHTHNMAHTHGNGLRGKEGTGTQSNVFRSGAESPSKPEQRTGASSKTYTDENAAQNASASHENRPPFYALYYIMRVK